MSKVSMPKNKLFTALFAALALVPAALVSAAPAAASSSQVSGRLQLQRPPHGLLFAQRSPGCPERDGRRHPRVHELLRRGSPSPALERGSRWRQGRRRRRLRWRQLLQYFRPRGGLAWQPGCLDPWRLFQGPGRNVGRVRQRWRRIARRFDGSTREYRSEHELRRAVASRSADRRARAARARRDRRRGDRTAPSCRRSPRRIAQASPRRRGRLLGPGWRAGSRARTCSWVSRWPPGCAQKRS